MKRRAKERTKLVLVVEDYDDARLMYRMGLEFAGFAVEEARDGEEALDKARNAKPDLILMDLALPKIDGWEVSRRLKADPATRGIPIVALTGHALESHARDAALAGCDAFIAKPCLPDDLANRVRKMLNVK
jgi:CheY-like chemotaxis protein